MKSGCGRSGRVPEYQLPAQVSHPTQQAQSGEAEASARSKSTAPGSATRGSWIATGCQACNGISIQDAIRLSYRRSYTAVRPR